MSTAGIEIQYLRDASKGSQARRDAKSHVILRVIMSGKVFEMRHHGVMNWRARKKPDRSQ